MISDAIKIAIDSSQRCQRNWDLSKEIDIETLSLLKYVIINSPSKQNEEFYNVFFITNRLVIEKIYKETDIHRNLLVSGTDYTKNSQALANLLVVFGSKDPMTNRNRPEDYSEQENNNNRNQAIGIAAGQLVLTANLLGLKTGFNACFNRSEVEKIVGCKDPKLIIGIGFPDLTKDRRLHQLNDKFFPTFNKPIEIIEIGNKTVINEYVDISNNFKNNIKLKMFLPKNVNISKKDFFDFKKTLLKQDTVFNLVKIFYHYGRINGIDSNAKHDHDEESNMFSFEWGSDNIDSIKLFQKGIVDSLEFSNFLEEAKLQNWTIEWE